jgi:uncharacterized membrane protein YkvI
MTERSRISAFSIASAFVGTLIGAGFASGQEMLQFFAVFGPNGIIGTMIASLLFILLAFIVMILAKKKYTEYYDQLVVPSGNWILRTALNILMMLFLFGIITVMIAGSGALFEQRFGLSRLTGSIFLAVVCAITVIMGLQGLVKSFNIVVPFMVFIALIVGILSIINPPTHIASPIRQTDNELLGNWFTSTLIYVSYNTLGAIAVLAPLGRWAKDSWNIILGATLGGVTLGILATISCHAIITHYIDVIDAQMPLMTIASSLGSFWGILYAIVLLAGIYTTAVGCLFAITARLAGKIKHTPLVIIIITLALLGSQFGFVKLIEIIYPISGYLGAIVCIAVLFNGIKWVVKKKKYTVSTERP